MSDEKTGAAYISYCRQRMTEEYLPRVKRCLDELTDEDIWWRAHESDNSIGNLLLHLSGNVRQWIVSGLGGVEYRRDRSREFSERERISREALFATFQSALQEADEVLEKFDPAALMEVRRIQIYDVTCLDALSHVVEHLAQHVGQIIYITKLRKGVDLGFYKQLG